METGLSSTTTGLQGPPVVAQAAASRVVPKLSNVQQRIEVARLAQVVPSLGKAYAHAVARWMGDPVLRLAGVPFITECTGRRNGRMSCISRDAASRDR